MTTKEMIELVQQHHPHMGEVEVVKLLNRAKDDFCAETEIVKKKYTAVSGDYADDASSETTTTANRMYYTISQFIIKIRDVWLNDVKISRLIGKPIIDDDTSEVD
jgi:hypothetical protein